MKQVWWPLRQSLVETLPNTGTVRAKTTITFELSLFSKFGGITVLEFGQVITVGCDHEACYQPAPRSMAGSATHSLTQRSARLSTHRTVVCQVTRQLARQGTHKAVPYKFSLYFYKRTLGGRGAKLLDDAQRTHRATSRQNSGRLPPEGGESQDITVERLQTQLAEMAQILIDNWLMKPTQVVEAEPSEDITKESNPPPWAGQNRRQRGFRASLDSQSDSKSVASSERRVSPSRTPSIMNLCKILNAKRNRGGDLRDKLNNRTASRSGKHIIPAGSSTHTTRPVPREPIPRYQTPFSRDIEGMDPPGKFTPPRFTLYDGKSDPRSYISHVRQMMALWNHLDELMCREIDGRLRSLMKKAYLKRWIGRVDSPGNEVEGHLNYEGNKSSIYRIDIARMKIENATLKESLESMEHLTSAICRLRLSLLKGEISGDKFGWNYDAEDPSSLIWRGGLEARCLSCSWIFFSYAEMIRCMAGMVKESVTSGGTVTGALEALDDIVGEAKLTRTALGSSLPISWSAEADAKLSSENYDQETTDVSRESGSEKVDFVSAAGFEMVEILILAAQPRSKLIGAKSACDGLSSNFGFILT
ncbi:myosin heavy chain-like protein [Actinidia rufa]|uniref:Myosin heavy chain-like protein n=1 Tax=Actinidia rufa TaxID=165716 RepID=A0A7J0H1B6_9ERIC|nr:myosin heavy chain-like protein [Actinidia rufa]